MGPFLRREGEGVRASGPALGLVETSSVARGFVVADQMVKRAPVALVASRAVSPGKWLVLVTGEVADVEEAMAAGVDAAGHTLVDRLELPLCAEAVVAALQQNTPAPGPEATL
jgi:microcompartment protein CcmL/EutN